MESMSRPPPSESEAVKLPPKSTSFFPNGALKKHNHNHYEAVAAAAVAAGGEEHHAYRECMKNHAASLGGHALDGCGEFMPSPTSDPSIPSSLLCAACSCHRNFHRRLPIPRPASDDSAEDDDSADEVAAVPPTRLPMRRSPSAFYSAPHMLLALSSGGGVAGSGRQISPDPATAPPRKRFRTKFTTEQKDRMHELSEQLGWRMRRHDEGFVDEKCREIGVGKGVFKVWMHNNKHNYLGGASSRRREVFFPAGNLAVRATVPLNEAGHNDAIRPDSGNPANGSGDDLGGASSAS